MIYQFKDLSIKQAAAAHHEKTSATYVEQGEAPEGTFRPTFKALTDNMKVPFKHDTSFHLDLRRLAESFCLNVSDSLLKSKKISNDQELIQSDPTSCPQNQKGNN